MRVLVIAGDPSARQALRRRLAARDYEVTTAPEAREGIALARDLEPGVVFCAPGDSEAEALAFLEACRSEGCRSLVILAVDAPGPAGGERGRDAVVRALRAGAYDCLQRPFSVDEAVLAVEKAVERESLREEIRSLRHQVPVERRHPGVVARSRAMREALELADRVARHPSSVLITGESGTGKERIARVIHEGSPRRSGPFVPVNCGAIPAELLESELFGHAEGAFTGAAAEREGLFEAASGGTLFLDEIAEMPRRLQVKLLRPLQDGRVRRVGDRRARRARFRVVAATARDLERAVRRDEFRSDLFYRLNVVRIHLPPLRHRKEDIPPLVEHFRRKLAERIGADVGQLTSDAMERMMEYPWPGNVRELENVVERAIVLAGGGRLGTEDLPEQVARGRKADLPASPTFVREDLSIKRRKEELEKRLLRRALQITGGNKTRAAELVDLSVRAVRYKVKEYGLQ